MSRRRHGAEHGFTLPQLLTLIAVIAAILLLVLSILAYLRSPSTITITEVSRTAAPAGKITINFTVTLTYATARTTAVTEEVVIQEDDVTFDNTLLDAVAIPVAVGDITSKGSFSLTCEESSYYGTHLNGTDGTSYFEREHEIHAEYGRFLFPNVKSTNLTVGCLE